MVSFILVFEAQSGALRLGDFDYNEINPWVEYGYMTTVLLYLFRLLTLLCIPQVSQMFFSAL